MKKAVVPTTAARGTAVSNRRMTAVQSVYIPAVETLPHPLRWRGDRSIDVPAGMSLQRVVSRFGFLPQGGVLGE
jgi:hypothetical protein